MGRPGQPSTPARLSAQDTGPRPGLPPGEGPHYMTLVFHSFLLLGSQTTAPCGRDKQMQRERLHAARELHPRLFHSITPGAAVVTLDTRDEMRRLPGH